MVHLQPSGSGVLDSRCERPTARVRSGEEGDLMMLCSVGPLDSSLISLFTGPTFILGGKKHSFVPVQLHLNSCQALKLRFYHVVESIHVGSDLDSLIYSNLSAVYSSSEYSFTLYNCILSIHWILAGNTSFVLEHCLSSHIHIEMWLMN